MNRIDRAALETHPHLHTFDPSRSWKYLIVGTFPPNTKLRKKIFVDYFYGNSGRLWRILHDVFSPKGYDFISGGPERRLKEIRRWQLDYSVALYDTIAACRRRDPRSTQDADLLDIVYNEGLRDYLLRTLTQPQKILFTSRSGKNAAYTNFLRIMGADLSGVHSTLITDLPSPSGSATIGFFSGGPETLGLAPGFFDYIRQLHPDLLPFFRRRWEIILQRRNMLKAIGDSPGTSRRLVNAGPGEAKQRGPGRSAPKGRGSAPADIPQPEPVPPGLVRGYLFWRYAQAFDQIP